MATLLDKKEGKFVSLRIHRSIAFTMYTQQRETELYYTYTLHNTLSIY